MSDSKKKIYLGEDLVCQTFTDAEEQAKAFDLFGLEQPVVSSNAPASTRPVQQGQVCELDGVNDRIQNITDPLGEDCTILVWLKVDAIGVAQYIYDLRTSASINSGAGYLYVDTSGNLISENGNEGTISAGVWTKTSVTHANSSTSALMKIGARYNNINTLGGKLSSFTATKTSTGEIVRQYNLNHASGITVYDSSGNGNHGELRNGASFVVDNTLPPEADRLNLDGYTDDGGVLKPRDESAPTNDIDGNPLQYSGSVYPRRPEFRNSYAASFDGVDDYISATHLTGSETVASSVGTSTPSISAGRVDFTAGTCGNLILSDGTQYPLTEGAGDTAHDISGNGNHGTINNASTGTEGAGFWAGRIDGEANALNNNNGFSKRMLFDGVDDEVELPDDAFNTQSAGYIEADVLCVGGSNYTVFGVASSNTSNQILSMQILATNKIRIGYGGANFVEGTTVLTSGVRYRIKWESNGTEWKIYIDGVEETTTVTTGSNTGQWFDEITSGSTRYSVGLLPRSSGDSSIFKGTVYDLIINNGTADIASYNGYGNTDSDWTDQVGSNNGTVNGSPALLRIPADTSDPTKDVLGDTLTNPAITDGYNGAETELDAYNIAEGENPSPATNNNPDLDAIEFGTDFAANDAAFMRLKSSTENDRLITFEDDLTGGDETLAQKYTQ